MVPFLIFLCLMGVGYLLVKADMAIPTKELVNCLWQEETPETQQYGYNDMSSMFIPRLGANLISTRGLQNTTQNALNALSQQAQLSAMQHAGLGQAMTTATYSFPIQEALPTMVSVTELVVGVSGGGSAVNLMPGQFFYVDHNNNIISTEPNYEPFIKEHIDWLDNRLAKKNGQ